MLRTKNGRFVSGDVRKQVEDELRNVIKDTGLENWVTPPTINVTVEKKSIFEVEIIKQCVVCLFWLFFICVIWSGALFTSFWIHHQHGQPTPARYEYVQTLNQQITESCSHAGDVGQCLKDTLVNP